jgi:hypothetical protein
MAAFRSSPMLPAQEATDKEDDDGVAAAAGSGLGFAAAGGTGVGAAVEGGLDRLDRDTRLSRASSPRVAGPWLRSS